VRRVVDPIRTLAVVTGASSGIGRELARLATVAKRHRKLGERGSGKR